MKRMRLLATTIVAGSLLAGGLSQRLFAQAAEPPAAAAPVDETTPVTPASPASGDAAATVDVSVKTPTKATATMGLSSKEIGKRAAEYSSDMQKMLRRILQLQAQARKDKDVIKLNCVNDRLVVAKQLLNLADQATIALTEATAADDVAEQEHQLSQLQISHEKVAGQRDDAETCLGEEIVFVGPNAVTITGLTVDNNPTDDDDLVSDNPNADLAGVEPVVYASPFAPL